MTDDIAIIEELKVLEKHYGELPDEKKKGYIEDLRQFPIEVIRESIVNTRRKWTYTKFPASGAIFKECEKLSGGQVKISTDKPAFNFDERTDAVRKAVFDYRIKFMKTNIGDEARAQGWDYQLERFVKEVAYVQEQILYPLPSGHIGLDHHVIAPEDTPLTEMDAWERVFLAEQRRLVGAHNSIDVAIPTGKVNEWRERAERARQRVEGYIASQATQGTLTGEALS